jgi:hypothetical protein
MVCRRQLEHRAEIGLSLACSDRHPRFKIRRRCFPIDAPLDDRSEAESEELNVRKSSTLWPIERTSMRRAASSLMSTEAALEIAASRQTARHFSCSFQMQHKSVTTLTRITHINYRSKTRYISSDLQRVWILPPIKNQWRLKWHSNS